VIQLYYHGGLERGYNTCTNGELHVKCGIFIKRTLYEPSPNAFRALPSHIAPQMNNGGESQGCDDVGVCSAVRRYYREDEGELTSSM
jgi:hypothetical protein